jgi:hypothetical protein
MRPDMPQIKTFLLISGALACILGWTQLSRFASTPGDQSAAPFQFPSHLPQLTSATRPVPSPLLLVFVHPQCSCTHATLQLLDQVLASNRAPVQTILAVYSSSSLDRKAAANPAAFAPATWLHKPFHLLDDRNGALARRFGAVTSGEIVLYSPAGRLLFQGGITIERGHLGDSPGAQALRHALDGSPIQNSTPVSSSAFSVFGCPIFRRPAALLNLQATPVVAP